MVAPEGQAGSKFLTKLGVIELGPRPETITCTACDNDHPAEIEYDAERRCYVHFCPEVGRVTVDDAALITYQFRPEWLVDFLVKALPIVSPLRRAALVPRQVWHLGDTVCGGTVVTIVFARRIIAQADLDLLASALRTTHRADKGVVITTSLHVTRHVPLPDGYELLPFPEIVRAAAEGLEFDRARFGSRIRGMNAGTAKGAPTRLGRPSPRALLKQIYDARRDQGLTADNDSAEARAIRAEWPKYAPDEEPPALATVRGHVARFGKAAASS